jgi:peptide-methionine (S)-S-oxide reductase
MRTGMILGMALTLCAGQFGTAGEVNMSKDATAGAATKPKLETATFGAGCYWCTEAVFQQTEGVKSVKSGFMGGHVKNPTYRQVCTGKTGHAEVVQIEFDPAVVSYDKLLDVFWHAHDPTSKDRQGADEGTQYRSVIFYHGDTQRKAAEESKRKLDASGALGKPVATEIVPAAEFYPAEDYHQNYYRNNKDQPYCRVVIAPKLKKLGLRE